MAGPPNAILAINSLDRFAKQGQTVDESLSDQYFNIGQPANNFTIQSGGAFIYGYIEKIVVSAIQLQYNVPTVVPSVPLGELQTNNNSTSGNDFLVISYRYFDNNTSAFIIDTVYITIPWGFYTPDDIAAILETLILQTNIATYAPNFTVNYSNVNGLNGGFTFNVNQPNTFQFTFWFPSPLLGFYITDVYLRTLRLLGLTYENSSDTQIGASIQTSTAIINFLYTPYVDIISEILTKFQSVKDTDTTANKLNSIIARIYLSGGGGAQPLTGAGVPLGSVPFTIVQDLNNPKIIKWSPEEAIYNIDFTLRDSYGDLLFTNTLIGNPTSVYNYNTEFQMTLLCSERKNR